VNGAAMEGVRSVADTRTDTLTTGVAFPSARRMATLERLLEAAAEIFREEGLQGASVEAICTRAGFTRGAFYSNFDTKEQLFLALLEREFSRRSEHLEAQVIALEPELREKGLRLSPGEVAHYIAEFFAPETDATTWFVLETEFLLLAMRDPSIAPGYQEFMDGFFAGIAGAIERVIGVAGRRFTIPVERAMPLLSSIYERALRSAALSGERVIDLDGDMSERLAELLFAITEPAD